ncbi:hypothetical protein EP331_03320 [bacterium]|nr:MAG: hypothetical protein EP331_03320 [bacterium]
MDIFKLIFHHDLLVEQLSGIDQNRTIAKDVLSLEDFMKPMPTYSRFYLAGSNLVNESFGLSSMESFSNVQGALDAVFKKLAPNQFSETSFSERVDNLNLNTGFIVKINSHLNYEAELDGKEYVREYGSSIRTILEAGDIAVFKVAANSGYDIQLFSMGNIYPDLFYAIRNLLHPTFRLFSINGKRLSSDRIFYFETYSLGKLPHGVEEVFKDTVY